MTHEEKGKIETEAKKTAAGKPHGARVLGWQVLMTLQRDDAEKWR